jgi:hypothetical protein
MEKRFAVLCDGEQKGLKQVYDKAVKSDKMCEDLLKEFLAEVKPTNKENKEQILSIRQTTAQREPGVAKLLTEVASNFAKGTNVNKARGYEKRKTYDNNRDGHQRGGFKRDEFNTQKSGHYNRRDNYNDDEGSGIIKRRERDEMEMKLQETAQKNQQQAS